MFEKSFSKALCVPTGLPSSVNCPFVGMVLTLCFNEERRWWGGGAFTFMAPRRTHQCSLLLHKAIRGPIALRLWEMLSPWWHSMVMTIDSSRLLCCMFAMMSLHKSQWETLMKCSAMNYMRTEGKNTSTEGGMVESALIIIIIIIKVLFTECLPN